MTKKIRTPMPVSQRAKQFAPFAAITGLDYALRKKEEEHRQQIEAEVKLIINPEENEGEFLSEVTNYSESSDF